MDAIDYTPPTTQEREFLDWAMAQHKAKRDVAPAMTRQERNALLMLVALLTAMQEGGVSNA